VPLGAPNQPGAGCRWRHGPRRGRSVPAPPRTWRRLRSRVPALLTRTVLRPPNRPQQAATFREQGRRWQPTLCSGSGRLSAPARRRPIEPGRYRRPRSRSRPAPRATARAAGRCSVAAPSTASAWDARQRLVWRQPPWPRRLGPDAATREPVGDPIRRTPRPASGFRPTRRPIPCRCAMIRSAKRTLGVDLQSGYTRNRADR
jgi:hypothetical protein